MGKIKEIHLEGIEQIEKAMDKITAEHGRVLAFNDYIDYLMDVFELEHIQKYRLAIFEYVEFLEWNAETKTAAAGEIKEVEFLQAFQNGGMFFLDEIETCSQDLLFEINALTKKARNE